MSLRLWLPLNGDLHNQGLINATPTVGGTSIAVNNSGKIGKCYSFGTASGYIDIPVTDIKKISGSCTIAFWLNVRSFNTAYATVFSANRYSAAWAEEMLTFQRDNNTSAYTFHISNGTSSTTNACKTGTLSTGVWYHFVLIADVELGQMRIYQNGELITTYNTSIIPNLGSILNFRIGVSNGGYQADMLLNDFRLYDEVLSVKEIRELSKGLVLHYPLNRGGFGADNLSTNSGDLTLWNKESGITCVWDFDKQMYKIQSTSTSSRWGIWQQVSCEPNTTYTFSVDGMKVDQTMYLSVGSMASGGWPPNQNAFTTKRNLLSYTWTKGSDHTIIRMYLAIYPTADGSKTGYYALPKLELGDIPTPWIPNSADTLYSSMGLDSNIVYDVSGYQNNGTITGTLNYSSDTPKYSVSTAFDGTQKIVTSSFTSEIKTMSAWVKTTKNKNTSQLVCADSASKLCISFYRGCIISYFASSGHSTGSRCTLGSSYIENGWNHIVVISTGSGTRDVYCNGVKLTPTNNDYWSPAAGFLIGSRNTSSGLIPFYGSISDVRAYATALSADDVLELYHTPASITNNGILMTQGEIVEV